MSKYEPLWKYLKENNKENYKLSYEEIKNIIWNEIKEKINKTLPRYKYIKHMVLTKEPLIKTSTNKTKRNEELAKVTKLDLQ